LYSTSGFRRMHELVLKRDPNSDGDEFYLVHHRDKVVGRIFKRGSGASEDAWFWGLSYRPGWNQPAYGNAETQKAAMAEFRARWDARSMLKKAGG
jgi:hypothetical protein